MPYKEGLKNGEERKRKKSKYRVTNASAYNQSLRKRGMISLYFPKGNLRKQFINDAPYQKGIERDQIIGATRKNFAGDRPLTTHGVQRHDTVIENQGIEQLGNCRNFIGFGVDLYLPKRQPLLTGPGANDMERALLSTVIKRTAHGLAINGDHLALELGGQRLGPRRKGGLESVELRIKH
jgi:hypothetical protein